MALFDLPRPDYLCQGEKARLIPSVADSSREGRITSILLATMMSVEEFGKSVLEGLDVRVGKTSKIQCFTEVVFKGTNNTASKIRPDGLIVVRTGNKVWSALVESKIGKAELNQEQVESYLDLAKQHNIDAVITISNVSVVSPTHHPLQFGKIKTRNVSLFHLSWMQLITEAIMWVNYYGVADSDQGYILSEFVRYLQHPNSGVDSYERMSSEWKDVCQAVQHGMPINKADQKVGECIASWYQLVRSLSLELSVAVGQSVTTPLKREHRNDPQKRLADGCATLAADNIVDVEFDVPNAASRIRLCADMKRNTVSVSMRLRAPEDRVKAKPRLNWLYGQLKDCSDNDLIIKMIWPSRLPDTYVTLGKIRENIDAIFPDKLDVAPIAFEIILSRPLGARFKGAQTFVQDTQLTLLNFYEQVGQRLREWAAKPPKLEVAQPSKVIDGTIDSEQMETVRIAVLDTPLPLAANEG